MKDNLSRTIYAKKIADEISDHYEAQKVGKESENMVFAISGKWGEGKTKLLDLLEPELCEKGFTIIRFNPWQYSQEDVSLKRAFLRIIKERLDSKEGLDDLYFDQSRTVIDWRPILQTGIKFILIGGFLFYILIPSLLGIYPIFTWWNNINSMFKEFWASGVGGVIFTALVIPLLIKTIVVSSRKAQITTAEEFDTKFKRLLGGHKKIVIFVDDLDRCTSSTVKLVLDSLRTFFYSQECSYVITGDHTVIERYAAEELNPKKEQLTGKDLEEGRRFLKKLFDVYWRLPLATPRVFKGFISEQIKKSGIKLTIQQQKNIEIFLLDDRLFERNPRHVRRFITALKFALQSVSLQSMELNNEVHTSDSENEDINEQKIAIQEILDNVDLLAKVLLIQEKFYPIYEKLVLYPASIVSHEKSLRAAEKSESLTIDGRKVFEDILESDTEALKNYVGLIMLEPQFTNLDNATIFDPTNFFSFSAATGLPSLKGPDETNFPQYLKSGQLADRLGMNLEASPTDKKTRLAQRALQVFDEASETERVNVAGESLKIASRLDEWSHFIDQWKERLFTLTAEEQEALEEVWWRAVLIKKPNLLTVIKEEYPDFFDSLWPSLEGIDKSTLHKDVFGELEKILKSELAERPPKLEGVVMMLENFNQTAVRADLELQLIDPMTCKVFLDSLQKMDLQDSVADKIVRGRLAILLGDIANLGWCISNREYLKLLGLFDSVKTSIKKWIKDLEQLKQIAGFQDALELSEGDKKDIADEIIQFVRKSASLDFLDDVGIQQFLDKEARQKIFRILKDTLRSNDDDAEKRKQASELLVQGKSVWNGLSKNDIYEFLKEIKKMKFGRVTELQEKQKMILDSWQFDDLADKKV